MNNKFKSAWIPFMLLVIAFMFCACGEVKTQYDANDEAGYNVSVRFDANGGEFTTSCSVLVDSFNISGMTPNANGMVELALISPDNEQRGASDRFQVTKNGYFLAGWYAKRTPIEDENGNVTYTYAEKWDFEKGLLEVDPSKTYHSSEPVITLYAAWVPKFTVEFYTLGSDEPMDTFTYDPTEVEAIYKPQWNKETGKLDMYEFPENKGNTFVAAYYDAAGTQKVGDTLDHPGYVDYTTGTAVDPSMKVYIDWEEGEWYHIYTAKQLADNASRTGCYLLCADLDFTDVQWPTVFSYGEFSGKINGNEHTISNVTITQTDNAKTRFGLFGSLTDASVLEKVTFKNITATIQSGARTSGIAYGLFAGNISAGATVSGVQILDSRLQIDSGCVLTSIDYVFGLICGSGNYSVIENAEIAVVAVGDNPESVTITVDETSGVLTVKID